MTSPDSGKISVMKILLFLLLPCLSFAQIKDTPKSERRVIGEAKMAGSFVASLSVVDSVYYLTYRDANYRLLNEVKTIYFDATADELDYLYQWMKRGCKLPKDSGAAVQVGEFRLTAYVYYNTSVRIFVSSSSLDLGSMALRPKDIDALFGKHEN